MDGTKIKTSASMTKTSVKISSRAERLRKGATIFRNKAILQNRSKKWAGINLMIPADPMQTLKYSKYFCSCALALFGSAWISLAGVTRITGLFRSARVARVTSFLCGARVTGIAGLLSGAGVTRFFRCTAGHCSWHCRSCSHRGDRGGG